MRFAQVVPDTTSVLPSDVFTYEILPEQAATAVVGARVEIPFGARELMGIIVETVSNSDRDVKPLSAVIDDEPLLAPHQVELAHYIARRYAAPLGEVIKSMLPKGIRKRPTKRTRGPRVQSVARVASAGDGTTGTPPPLTPAQQQALQPLRDAIDAHTHRRVLLHGVTGSGKTEVYLAAIDAAQAKGRQAIVMVPEIALTPQVIERFARRFGGRIAVLHSALTDAERAHEWRRTRAGDVDVVIGSRSAIFAPVPRLGLVVVDEEDATAYKQDRIPRYHAVDVALEAARLANAAIVLGSATPRIETFFAAHSGELELVALPERIGGRPLPPVEVVDLREELKAGNFSPLSYSLEQALTECHREGGQSILFLNRRGTAPVVMCRSCGAALTCSRCSVSLVFHASRRSCDCHYCGESRPLPTVCPACASPAIKQMGTGTERLEAEVRERFPQLRLMRMDRDTTQTRDSHFEIFNAFRDGKADCLIGTQMVTKGWDLGNVRLVGIVNADSALHFPDYRSGEITFSLITQVAGRAGRGDNPARVILQTYSPSHYAIEYGRNHDYLGFARHEIRIRKQLAFPPYVRLCTVTYSHRDPAACEAEVKRCVTQLSAQLPGDVRVLGPTPAFLHRLRGEYRWEFTLAGPALDGVLALLPQGRAHGGAWSLDVDPAL